MVVVSVKKVIFLQRTIVFTAYTINVETSPICCIAASCIAKAFSSPEAMSAYFA